MGSSVRSLNREECAQLAAAIGETPETLMTIEQLRRGLCRATVCSPDDRPFAAIVQPDAFPTDATAFGTDPDLLLEILRTLEGWTCVDIQRSLAQPMAERISAASGRPCQLFEEIFYVLERPIDPWPHSAVRRLTAADLPPMEAATEALNMGDWRFGSAAALIADGFVAGAVIDGELVAVGFTAARGEQYADVGIVTREDWRGHGLSTAAAALVCEDIQDAGQTPVWGTSIDNLASQRVAAKLGFEEVSRRVYVCLD
jgi:RimJ/RimL family protein N-acetyltransferase